MASLRRRFSELPDPVDTVVIALALSAVYFATAAILELLGLVDRLPLAPTPWLGLCVSLLNVGLTLGLLHAVGWVRPFVMLVPFAAYPFEYGLTVPNKLFSLQGAELLAVTVLMPAAVIYFLYLNESARDWFSGTKSTDV